MKELYDPVYYPPSIQGFNENYNPQHQQQVHSTYQRHNIQRQQSSSSSKASTVLGRFLKLGKSKSDASGYALNTSTTSSSGRHNGSSTSGGHSSSVDPEALEVDEFRLSPSVRVARGPVEKMVHKANSRKDVSRSHSWIYGSVKLPSDLPFGYADTFSFNEGDGGDSEVMTMTMEQVEQHQQRGGGHYLHTHAVQAMQIPRCQLDYYCTCDCGGGGDDFDMMMMSTSGRPMGPGGSVRGGRKGRGSGNGPCQACAREMAMKYALPSSSKHRKSGGESSESFVSSVRKLTWKSLKQVVKKRPSIDTLKKMPQTSPQSQQIHPEYLAAPIVPMPFLSPGAISGGSEHSKNPLANLSSGSNNSHYGNPRLNGAVVSHNGAIHSPMMIASPQSSSSSSNNGIAMSPHPNGAPPSPANELSEQSAPNYFFPEKKGFYASCNDIYGDEPPPHVTASVRVRPKRTRQPYEFPSEFGPVANYEEEAQQLYHSEWDLRQVMSYDVWMNTTSHVKPRPESGGPSPPKSTPNGKNSQQTRSSGNLHVPPPDYPPPEPLPNSTSTTFRPHSRSSSSAAAERIISPSISTNPGGSVKVSGTSSRSSRASLASLQSSHSSKSSSSSSKSTAKNSQSSASSVSSSDTLTISSFANNPPKQTKTNNNPIIKRSSILAADVSAYQLLKQQTKKNQGKSVQVQVKQQSKPAAVKPAPIPAKDMLEDAFSESSDDLSDNAITGSASSSSTTAKINAAIPTPSAEEAAKRGRVRIAGQGIRMAPNNNNINRNKNLPQKNSSAVSSAAPPPPKMKESGSSTSSSRTSTFTSYRSQQTPTKKSGSSVTLSRKDSSGSEDDVWSDCHTDLPYTENKMIIMSSPQQNMMDYKNHHNQTQLIQTQHVSSKSRDQNHQQQSKGVSMKVNGENVHNNNNTMIVSANMNTSRNHNELQPTRATFVTFEQQPPNKNGNKNSSSSSTTVNHHDQGKMEFEEYEFDQNGGASRDRPKTKTTISKGDNSNVVSLNVPRNPMANPSPTSGSTMQHQNHHQTYIKHSKGQQSTSSAAATGKFGALRRRKSRNGPNNPGKLLQETIYEEDVEQIDDFNGSQNQNNAHAVKIMVSTGSSPPVATAAPPLVKPILKNRERTYETPVINSSTVTNGNAGSSCSINNSSKSDNFTAESQINNNDIYFDSSISTVSTASKKKVQFDPSKLVVCGGNSEEDCSEEYDDDSDQWSAKSEEEDNNEQEENQNQQRKTPIQVPSGNNGDCKTGLETIDNSAGAKSNGNNAPNQSQEQQALAKAKARTSFEEEVARKAASFAKSREAAAAKAKEEEETKKKGSNSNNHNDDDDHVNNLPRQKQTGGCKTTENEQKQLVVIPRISTVNVSRNNNINTNISNGSASKPTKDSQALSSFNKRNSTNNRENSQRSNDRNGEYDKDNNKDSPSIQWDSDAEIFKNGTNSRVLNPNSLLFHDTTRIRLNSRPALQENTFNSTSNNGKGGGSGVAGRLTRLKQSNSFRSVTSMPLRPREPPPPPPQANNSKHSLASVVPSRLQKALSTSTLLSKSTERLHNLSNSKTSHYGPGGKLLPSKSQISLPLDYTTTSNQATKAVGIAGSVETLNLTGTSISTSKSSSTTTSYQKQNSTKTTQPPKSNKYIRASSSSSTRSLANRSKSLTDKCEALEKVLSSSKRNQHYQPGLSLSREDISSPQPLKTAESLPHLPPQDMDSKSIEIVTKENDVSEIRIYSSSSALPSFPNDENLPYQGIIYESTKTLITTTSPDKSHPEIHYAATDLFPASGVAASKPQPPVLSPAPPTKTTTVPKPGEVETVGKSVVLIIDNSKKSVDTKSQRKESPLTYSQPIDTIPKVRALPQIPPAEKAKEQVYSVEENQEPLYDDVINHVDPCPPPKTELRAGSLGRKSISSLINSSTKGKEYKCLPPHQLGELPPLPPPPVPPHRSLPTQPGSGQVVSSTLPCPACPPSLPPPNLPSKNLSEFHNRPLVIQENEEDYLEESSVINGFPEATLFRSPAAAAPEEDLEQEVDNLYNDIGTPTNTSLLSSPGLVIGQHSSGAGSTMKSSTAAAFASAMKEAFLGAIKSMDFDKRSVHSSSSSSAGSSSHKQNQQSLNQPEASELIYDDTALINHSKMQNSPLPQPPSSNKSSTSSSSSSCPTLSKNLVMKQQQNQNVVDEIQDDEEEQANEPLYDDVLNLTQLEKSKELISQNQNQPNGEYHSSNSSDSGTEDLPPPLPTQGPPPLSKVATDFHFPVLPSIPLQPTTITGGSTASSEVPKSKASESSAKNDDEDSSSDKEVLDRTRSLLNELNEKLSKLNFTPEPSSSSSASSTSPGASSFSSTSSSGVDTKGELSHLAPGDFSTYISKVVISPSSESSGVEEDYNSEKNYSLSNGSDAASSSDENYKMSQVSKLVSETISLARGKFLENMKLSMLSGGNANNSNNNNNQDSQGQSTPTGPGLLMMSSEKGNSDDSRVNNNNRNNTNIEEEEEEPIYEEIGDKPEKASRQSAPIPDIVEEDEEEDRSGSPVYADAFDAKSMFDGASRSEILSFLESIRDRLTGAESTSSSESQSSSISSKKDGKFLDLVERNDSGIGSESGSLLVSTKTGIELTKLILPASSSSSGSERSSSPPEMQIKAGGSLSPCPSRKQLCSDCNDVDLGLEEDPTVNTGVAHPPPHLVHHHHHHLSSEDVAGVSSSGPHSHSGRGVCRSCNRKRNEKKEIIMEIYETELKYGRDLRIISEEFYKPIQIAGLLAKEQLDQIFLNVDELSQISLELTSRLKMAIHKSTNANGTVTNSNETNKQGDEDLSDVNVGKIFLQLGESMMTAFENYCTRQANAGALLSQLEKEKELLRIFLRVSQMENTVLRRMNLPAFLMVPVQRVTRYPLLLSRLVKVTPADHFSRDELQMAQEKIEQHLEHMNKTTREVASVKLWRRISIINGNSSSNNSAPVHRRSNSDLDTSNIRIRKMAMDVMDWSNFNDVSCVIDNQLGSVHFNGKAMRNIYGCLLARGKDLDLLASKMDQDLFFPPAEDVVKDVKLVLVRVKNTRFCLLREPLCLSKCVVSQGENEFQDFIEINEITTKNTYFIQGLDKQSTGTWLKFLQCYSSCVGHWRRRRPALANIMMNGMIKHL